MALSRSKGFLKLFEKHNIGGYTIINDIEGSGGHGLKTGDDVTGVFSNTYIFACS